MAIQTISLAEGLPQRQHSFGQLMSPDGKSRVPNGQADPDRPKLCSVAMPDQRNRLVTVLMQPDAKSCDYIALGSIATIAISMSLYVCLLFAL
jgi:hypothetical protein